MKGVGVTRTPAPPKRATYEYPNLPPPPSLFIAFWICAICAVEAPQACAKPYSPGPRHLLFEGCHNVCKFFVQEWWLLSVAQCLSCGVP